MKAEEATHKQNQQKVDSTSWSHFKVVALDQLPQFSAEQLPSPPVPGAGGFLGLVRSLGLEGLGAGSLGLAGPWGWGSRPLHRHHGEHGVPLPQATPASAGRSLLRALLSAAESPQEAQLFPREVGGHRPGGGRRCLLSFRHIVSHEERRRPRTEPQELRADLL